MFWDGSRWIDERATERSARANGGFRRIRDWLATIPVVLLVPALSVPILWADAAAQKISSGATVSVVGPVAAGRSVKIAGTGFTPDAHAAILWDANAVLGEVITNGKGTFATRSQIPPQAAAGEHVIAVAYEPVVATSPPAASIEVSLGGGTFLDPTAVPTEVASATAEPPAPPPTSALEPAVQTPAPTAGAADPAATSNPGPTPQQTPDPTPKPTPVPTPPTPPIGERPFAAPVTTGTYSVPASIDDTGATDVSAALNDWIDRAVPDGSVIEFPGTGTFLLSEGIKIGNRSGLVFRGNGARLRLSGSGGRHLSSGFVIGWSYRLGYWTGGNSHITIDDFTMVGNDPTPGIFDGGGEDEHAIRCNGSAYIEASGVTVNSVYGDGVFVDGCDDVWVHDNHVVTAGRNGLTVVQGARVLAEANDYDRIGYVVFDDEPNYSTEASRNITFRNNTAGRWGLDFVSIDGGHRGASIRNVTITGNVTTGQALSCLINNGGAVQMENIVFSDNHSAVPAAGPRLYFAYVDGLTITGNVQPLTSGELAKITNSTGVTYP